MKKDYYDGLYGYLSKLINDYCKRHGYIIMEIDWLRRNVYYYKEEQDMFKDYTSFNYLKVDLMK